MSGRAMASGGEAGAAVPPAAAPPVAATVNEGGAAASGASTNDASGAAAATKKGTAVLVLGMAGSGKTSFVQRLNAHLHTQKKPCYIVNLDPAVSFTPLFHCLWTTAAAAIGRARSLHRCHIAGG